MSAAVLPWSNTPRVTLNLARAAALNCWSSRSKRRLAAALVALFSSPLLGAHATVAQDHPGWSTKELLAELSTLAGKPVEAQSADNAPQTLLIDPTEELSCFVGPGDSMRYVQAGEFSSLFLIGNDTRIHTIQFYYPVVTISGNEGAPAFFQAVFPFLFPNWPEASKWPIGSLQQSWEATGLAMVDPTVSVNETIARHSEEGARLATTGVPPDVIWYRVTTRSECEKVSPNLLASPREPIKDQARLNPVQQHAQLRLNYIHPRPVDVSATPLFLGASSGKNRTTSTSMTFEVPAAVAEISDWTERQARSDRYASTTAAIREFWGYQEYFLYLITDPAVPVQIDGKPALAVIEEMDTEVYRSGEDKLKYRPLRAEAVLFASAAPNALRAVDALDISYGEGMDFVSYGRGADPIDVSATPIYLGRMQLYRGGVSGDRPGYYAIAPSDLGITVKDRTTGEQIRVDLRPWAIANGVDAATIGGHLIVDPMARFDFRGKPHALLIEGIEINRKGSGLVEFLSGHVFAAR